RAFADETNARNLRDRTLVDLAKVAFFAWQKWPSLLGKSGLRPFCGQRFGSRRQEARLLPPVQQSEAGSPVIGP
ncbi:MAG: hypothetical protein ABI885_17795, partial [Gammaproteobacteria bacterium]